METYIQGMLAGEATTVCYATTLGACHLGLVSSMSMGWCVLAVGLATCMASCAIYSSVYMLYEIHPL